MHGRSSEDGTGAQLILVLGGARSGKSTFAERLARRSERSVALIATALAGDDDMRERILHHQATRPREWQTIEEPLKLAEAVNLAARKADVVLLDCITTWLGNWLMTQGEIDDEADTSLYDAAVLQEVDALLAVLNTLGASKTLVVISNEVGLGIVPAYTLGRVYRDILGRVNQRLATAASRVYLMMAGLAVDIKRLHEDASL